MGKIRTILYSGILVYTYFFSAAWAQTVHQEDFIALQQQIASKEGVEFYLVNKSITKEGSVKVLSLNDTGPTANDLLLDLFLFDDLYLLVSEVSNILISEISVEDQNFDQIKLPTLPTLPSHPSVDQMKAFGSQMQNYAKSMKNYRQQVGTAQDELSRIGRGMRLLTTAADGATDLARQIQNPVDQANTLSQIATDQSAAATKFTQLKFKFEKLTALLSGPPEGKSVGGE